MDGLDEWQLNLQRAERLLIPGEVLKLQRSLVFLTLGAAVEISPGRFRRLSGVVLLTPVDTGRARSSWNVALGQPDTSWPSCDSIPRSIDAAAAAAALRRLGTYDTVWITSSLPYIKVLEYGGYPASPGRGTWDPSARQWVVKSSGGYSRQAPRGMVRITVAGIRDALGASA
jgi:hypothetical protein